MSNGTPTGPPYPHPTFAPGSTGIGQIAIGVTPLGSIPTFDPWVTIISQYANSPILTGIINSFNSAMDFTQTMDSFYDMIWNVLTAQGYGLELWGRIVGVSRILSVPTGAVQYLGFGEANSWSGFNQGGIFYSGGQLTGNFILTDTDFRRLILAKIAANVSDGSIHSINSILLALFPNRGPCYVADGLNMTLTLTFNFLLSAIDMAIISLGGVLPLPAGVVVNIAEI